MVTEMIINCFTWITPEQEQYQAGEGVMTVEVHLFWVGWSINRSQRQS